MSPTRWIAFVGEPNEDGVHELGLVDISGSAPSTVVSPFAGGWPRGATIPTPYSQVSLSPDGHYLAFLADATTAGSDDLYVVDMRAPSPVAVNVTHLPPDRDTEMMLWAPDSAHLAFVADQSQAGVDELFVVDLTAGLGAAVQQRAHGPLSPGQHVFPTENVRQQGFRDAVWSADSERIYFRASMLSSQAEAFMFDLTRPAAGAERLHPPLSSTREVSALYAVGSRTVLLVGPLERLGLPDIFAVDTSGPLVPVRLSPAPATTSRGIQPARDGEAVRVSPDQTKVLFLGNCDAVDIANLYFVDLTSGASGASAAAVVADTGHVVANADTLDFQWGAGSERFVYREGVGRARRRSRQGDAPNGFRHSLVLALDALCRSRVGIDYE